MKDFGTPRSQKKSVIKSGQLVVFVNSQLLVDIKMLNKDQV